ncbi:putative RNA polymerase [Pseudomonas phage MR6]|uniref:DNA-directed RNA polymerase n=1 Tax=Pseudomonas phage MR5 TaxID=2711172 RepID=A0A6M3TCQ2_9CAUD|nr:putative RNA polymerase [Pseudomonas phage MR5]QJD54861.1 putative RNA polymerase [Pseudomonas phage MR6]QJD54921.1 putative RNA polymerase [Pseudomonas phage MR7]QJD54981.1 putative RNA polymerase [Pseudomonas phage MR8]QJD55038.1 putative RNA polymerase [Pseudomonas phage MR12]QJD55341.1 putative RNA polymerase [Pseudomonas phage MR18]QJF74605.1 putative RNA polymerase [Pseudomonas phage MR16]
MEVAADDEAATQAIREHAEIIAKGDIDKLPRGKVLIGRMFSDVRASIEAEQAKVIRGVGGKVRGWLRKIPADVASVIALRCTLMMCMQVMEQHAGNKRHSPATMQRIATTIGREWVREIQVRQAAEVSPAYYQSAVDSLSKANISSPAHVKRTLARVVKNVLDGTYDIELADSELLHLGKHGLQACVDAGLVELVRSTSPMGKAAEFVISAQVAAFLLDSTDVQRMATPADCIMITPPIPWEATAGGGYLTERRQLRYPLLHTGKRRVRPTLRKQYRTQCSAAEMPQVYRYVNYLQSIPYRMNAEVYAHVRRIWSAGGGALHMTRLEPPAKPEFPFATGWAKERATEAELETFRRWKRHMTQWHEQRLVHRSLVWEMASFVKNVARYSKHDAYFPVFLDGRGRLYYRGTPNPQGSDAAKAVIQFARKKPLGPRGAYWLKVHIANCFGFDKLGFDARAAWTDQHWDELQQGLELPEESNLYQQADSPFCAIAAAIELRGAYRSGNPETFCSGLAVHMDATCSGLQHFSAMLQDEVGGAYVNLTPGAEQKADIYRRVAELAMLQVHRDAEGGNEYAQQWLTVGVSRDMAKGPVMTYVYGATLSSVADGLEDRLDAAGWRCEGMSMQRMSAYMAKLLFAAIADTVPAAAAAMRWLKELVRKTPRDKPIQFTTPIGMFVNHDYPDEEMERIAVRSCGMQYIVMYKQLETTKPLRMQNAIAPNFVHSLDGAHLGYTALRMEAHGLDMVCIHDSFGTHPGDVDVMHTHIREAFIHLYTCKDHLNDLAEQLGLDVTYIGTGKLDLTKVRESEFFFC